jgi:hypothetical protein
MTTFDEARLTREIKVLIEKGDKARPNNSTSPPAST